MVAGRRLLFTCAASRELLSLRGASRRGPSPACGQPTTPLPGRDRLSNNYPPPRRTAGQRAPLPRAPTRTRTRISPRTRPVDELPPTSPKPTGRPTAPRHQIGKRDGSSSSSLH
ncbi:hypothetical protein DAI22_05g130400 [Oryza sativa Japonica Group]|nr:hypothetical protein DAI22_05g130400 [Oryza sativa Japonica Group]